MISIVAKFTVKQGKETEFLKLINELGEASRAEAGCLEYILHKDVKNANIYCLIEKWKDQEAVDFHNNTPHFTGIVPKIVELAGAEIDVYTSL
ncbi:antibiotic biosynthesis monooxygenase [Maribellus sp. CM-23]|uniref:putative quinol monooxygenase n=1 Tax=Maribellus sp. CM-23 TaxID=2781026 RepID=UPI001F1C2223|nr:putative quinol monooxygenase [Maribellus sp. CM-23]MCE4564433.1 antibiotic biosynthesis monooxygenase [Maribellus sp. CM-23]